MPAPGARLDGLSAWRRHRLDRQDVTAKSAARAGTFRLTGQRARRAAMSRNPARLQGGLNTYAGSRGSNLNDLEDEGKFAVARAQITYCPAIPDHNFSECLHGEVGFSEANFRRLVRACGSGRLSSVRMHGIVGAFSTSGEFGVPRDVLVPAGSRLNYHIGTISLEYNI